MEKVCHGEEEILIVGKLVMISVPAKRACELPPAEFPDSASMSTCKQTLSVTLTPAYEPRLSSLILTSDCAYPIKGRCHCYSYSFKMVARKPYPRSTFKRIIKAHSNRSISKNLDILVSEHLLTLHPIFLRQLLMLYLGFPQLYSLHPRVSHIGSYPFRLC